MELIFILFLAYILSVFYCWSLLRKAYIASSKDVGIGKIMLMFLPVYNVVMLSLMHPIKMSNKWKDRIFLIK